MRILILGGTSFFGGFGMATGLAAGAFLVFTLIELSLKTVWLV